MRTIEIYSYPFQRGEETATRLVVDKQEYDNQNNRLTQYIVKKPMSKWLNGYKRKLFVWRGFLYELALELNASDYTIEFYGTEDEYKVFGGEILRQKAQLEQDGRKISVKLVFHERSDCKRAVSVMTEVYEALIHKEYTDNNYEARDKIDITKDRLTSVGCLVKTYGTMPKDFNERLRKQKLIKIKEKNPALIAAVFGKDFSGDIPEQASLLLKDGRFRKALIIIPKSAEIVSLEAAEKAIAQKCSADESAVRILRCADDPIDALTDGIYSKYMPDIITDSIKKFYEIIRVFSDYDTDSYIIESADKIDGLFE